MVLAAPGHLLGGRITMLKFTCLCTLLLALAIPATAGARIVTVPRALDSAERRGYLDRAAHDRYLRIWKRARRAVRRLDGPPRANLDATLTAASSLARRGLLGERVAPVFLTIERNYEWFWKQRRPAAAYGARTTFDPSPVIFQFYPESGWQIQPLANFGRLNGLARATSTDLLSLAAYARELLPLAVDRNGFLAFEHYFAWSGGKPGWISGMATATAVQALGRVTERTGDATFAAAAERLLPAFFRRPPTGVKLVRGRGRVHYLQYSQSPRLLIGNAFAQTLIGLEEFSSTSGSRRARLALQRGINQAEHNLDRYDTGAWSLYWRRPGSTTGAESDLHYHRLFMEFLDTLCERTDRDVFCDIEERFARYEQEPVRVRRMRAKRRGDFVRVRWAASKRGSARVMLIRGNRVIRVTTIATARGSGALQWRAPAEGSYVLRVETTSLNGVRATATRDVDL